MLTDGWADDRGLLVCATVVGFQTILMLDVERFSTPEVLFHPSDIGIKQAGVAEAIVQAVEGPWPTFQPTDTP